MDDPALSIAIRRITGVEDLRECVQGAALRTTQLTPGRCSGILMHTGVDGLAVSAGLFRGDVRIRGVMAPAKVTLGTILGMDGYIGQWCCQGEPGDLFVFPCDGEQEGRFWGTASYATISLSLEELTALAPSERLADPALWSRIGHYRAAPDIRQAMIARLDGCLRVLQSVGPELSPRARSLLREEIVDAFLATLADAVAVGPDLGSTRNGALIVKLAEDYVAAHGGDVILVQDLCRELCIARRTLDRVFQEQLGMGPKSYLRLVRLSAVRARLMETHPAAANVTSIALDHGFWELGRFSVQYRRMFGETPAQTLRRPPGPGPAGGLGAFDWRLRSGIDQLAGLPPGPTA